MPASSRIFLTWLHVVKVLHLKNKFNNCKQLQIFFLSNLSSNNEGTGLTCYKPAWQSTVNALLLLKLLNWSWKSAFPSHLESSFIFTLMPYKVKITKILLLSKYLWVLTECIIQDQWFKSMLVSSQTENSLMNWSISFFPPFSIFSVQNGSDIKWVLHGHRILALTAISSYMLSMHVQQNYWSTHLTLTIKAHISQNSRTLLDEGKKDFWVKKQQPRTHKSQSS